MKVEIYVANENTDCEIFFLQYVNSDVVIKAFEKRSNAERYAKKYGYDLVK